MQAIPPKNPKSDNPNEWDQFQDMSEFLFNPVSKSVAFIQFLGDFIFNVLRLALVPAEVIFRHNFGVRHFNLYLYVGGTLWLALFATGWLNFPAAMGFRGEGLVPNHFIFTVVAVLFYGRMFWQFFKRHSNNLDLTIYSKYDGDVLPFLYALPLAKDSQGNRQEYRVRQLHEPVFMLLLGVLCTFLLNPQTGTWLIISALSMAVKEYVKATTYRNLILDQIDNEIISRNMASAMNGDAPKDTQGVYIAGISTEGKGREQLDDLLEKRQQRFTANSAA